MIRAFDYKNNQVNKNSKKRKILADKWVLYGLKWSPYENSPQNSMGVTNYAGTSVPIENDFKKSIKHAVSVFRLPLADLFIRQKMVMDLVVQAPFSEAGLAVAVGKNYASSSHTDEDMAFTYAYVQYYLVPFSYTAFFTGGLLALARKSRETPLCFPLSELKLSFLETWIMCACLLSTLPNR